MYHEALPDCEDRTLANCREAVLSVFGLRDRSGRFVESFIGGLKDSKCDLHWLVCFRYKLRSWSNWSMHRCESSSCSDTTWWSSVIGSWYVSNVSIIFDCSMLYYLFWTLLGFVIHFYIIFGTNVLTGGPAQNWCFCLFQSFAEKEYQTESRRNETFGNVIFGTNMIQETWTLRQETKQEATR